MLEDVSDVEKMVKEQAPTSQHVHSLVAKDSELFIAQLLQKNQESRIKQLSMENRRKHEQLTSIKQHYELLNNENEKKLEQELSALRKRESELSVMKAKASPNRTGVRNVTEIPFRNWTRDELYFWLVDELNIDGGSARLVFDQGFDGHTFEDITEEDLEGIGVSQLGVRRKMVKNIDLLKQREVSATPSTLADSVAWNSMYRGVGGQSVRSFVSMTDSVFSEMASVSQADAQKQMSVLQERLQQNPELITQNPQFMMSLLHCFASSQNVSPMTPTALPVITTETLQEAEEEEEEEEEDYDDDNDDDEKVSQLMPTDIGAGDKCNGMDSQNSVTLKQTERDAKAAVTRLARKLHESMTQQQMTTITNVLNESGDIQMDIVEDDEEEEDVKYEVHYDHEDSDSNRSYDYDEKWMTEDTTSSLTVLVLSPYKALRKSWLRLCVEPEIIEKRSRTLSYKRYEKVMQCGEQEFTFRILEGNSGFNWIPDLLEREMVHCVWMVFPLDPHSAATDEVYVLSSCSPNNMIYIYLVSLFAVKVSSCRICLRGWVPPGIGTNFGPKLCVFWMERFLSKKHDFIRRHSISR